MPRLIDSIRRYGSTFWEGEASGAAVLISAYESPDREKILPAMASGGITAMLANSPVAAAFIRRMSLFSEARFCLQAKDDLHTYTNGSLSLLQEPWPDGTEGELLARMELDALYAGNGYIWQPPGEGRLVRLRPDWVTIVSELVYVDGGGTYRRLLGYFYDPPREQQPEFGPSFSVPESETAHWAPIPDPQANFKGMSVLTPVIREIDADNGMTAYKQMFLENAATPNLVVKYDQKLQPSTIDSLRERITTRYGGRQNAFKTLVLDQGADATVIGANFAQMSFDTVQSAGVDRVLAPIGIPAEMLGLSSVSGSGAGQLYGDLVQQVSDMVMRPEWRSCCAALQKLVPDLPSGSRLWFDTSQVAALQESEQTKAQAGLIRAQQILTLRNAGFTQDSVVVAVMANDWTKLVPDPNAQLRSQTSQHMLTQPPGSGRGPTVVEDVTPRLNAAPSSPGNGSNTTQAAVRPASVRRELEMAVWDRWSQ